MENPVEDRQMMHAHMAGLVSGLSSHLIGSKELGNMKSSRNMDEMITILENTTYSSSIKALGKDISLRGLEEALTGIFLASYEEAVANLPKDERRQVDILFKGVWDLRNIKAVSRAIGVKTSCSETSEYIRPFGTIPKEELVVLCESKDLNDFADAVRAPYSDIVKEALKTQSHMEYEMALDKLFIKYMVENTGGDVRDYVRMTADLLNIKTILLCKTEHVQNMLDHLAEDGLYLSREKLNVLNREEISNFPSVFSQTPYAQAIRTSTSSSGQPNAMDLESKLFKSLVEEAKIRSQKDPLSLNPVIHYLMLKEKEVMNIQALIAARWYKIPQEDVEGLIS